MQQQEKEIYLQESAIGVSGTEYNTQQVTRIDRNYIVQQISAIFSIEKGFFFTLVQMTVRPGLATRDFIAGNRTRYMKPIVFLILCSLIYTLLNKLFGFEDEMFASLYAQNTLEMKFTHWIQANYGYVNMITSVITALWVKMLFRKYPYNIFEIIVLVCFYSGVGMLILGVLGIVQSTTGLQTYFISFIISTIHSIWSIGQFFNAKKVTSYIKALISVIIGFISFTLIVAIIMIAIKLMEPGSVNLQSMP